MSRLISVASIGVCAVALLVILTGGHSYLVRAEFADAAGLRPDFTVRLDGVSVGRVASVAVTPRDTAIATLELDSSAAPVGRDARVSIQPSNLLGEKFVALEPGDIHDPAPSGALIPLSRTSTPTELDQVISAFGPDTRTALAIFLAQQGDALLGRGTDLATTLSRMPHSLTSATKLVADLGAKNQTLGRLIDQSDRILVEVTAQRRPLGQLVQSASGAFTTLASREADLGSTVQAAPGAVVQLRRTLIALQAAAVPVGLAADGLRKTAAPLTQTLLAVPPFAAAAAPALRTVSAVAPSLQRLGLQATPVVSRLRGLGATLDTFAHSLNPVTQTLNVGIGDLLGVMEGWARAIQGRDAAGHVFRTQAALPPAATLESLLGAYLTTGSASRPRASARRTSRPAAAGRAPVPSPAATASPSRPGAAPALPPLPPVRIPKLPVAGSSSGNAAGTLSKLLNYLLGR
jgi:phospholipid/cholesterol/gamma-HCH transport system substrate-binding protein